MESIHLILQCADPDRNSVIPAIEIKWGNSKMTLCLAVINYVETVPKGWGSISCSSLTVGGRANQRATRRSEERKRTTSVALTESQKKKQTVRRPLNWNESFQILPLFEPTMVREAGIVYFPCKFRRPQQRSNWPHLLIRETTCEEPYFV